jgi:hypothetical protein
MKTVKQMIVEAHTGHVVLLHMDGTIRRQVASPNVQGACEWRDVSIDDLPSRPVQAGVDYRGRITVLCQDGSLHLEVLPRPGEFRQRSTWKEIEPPKE